MGKPSTGAITTKGTYRIELKKLQIIGMVQEGKILEAVMRYHAEFSITIIVNYINDTPLHDPTLSIDTNLHREKVSK